VIAVMLDHGLKFGLELAGDFFGLGFAVPGIIVAATQVAQRHVLPHQQIELVAPVEPALLAV
jgi:hypothetical protein